jgi:2-polyprenyl-3-methyl-5-hydroxy-6-metoxy-1,4-benzoquinol methylase
MIHTWSSGAPDAHMAEELLTDLSHLVRQHPWWQARARLALRLLTALGVTGPASVLDAGCGWGVTLAALETSGYRTVGLDVSPQILQVLDTPQRQLVEADLTQPAPAHVKGTFDAVLALDVIEHIDDDHAVVATLGTLLKPGGYLIVSVPALPDLFSEFDRVQGHRRRYTMDRLATAFENTGVTLVRSFWWGGWMVPVLRLQRQNRRRPAEDLSPLEVYREFLRVPSGLGRLAMKLAFHVDERIAIRGMNGTGTSLFAVGRR